MRGFRLSPGRPEPDLVREPSDPMPSEPASPRPAPFRLRLRAAPGRAWLAMRRGLRAGYSPRPSLPMAAKQPTPAQKEAELKQAEPAYRQGAQVRQRGRREARQAVGAAARCRARRAGGPPANSTTSGRSALAPRPGCADWSRSRRKRRARARRRALAQLAGELRTAYVNGREEQLKLASEPGGPGELWAHARLLRLLRARPRRAAFVHIQEKLEHLALVREKIAAETAPAAGRSSSSASNASPRSVVAGRSVRRPSARSTSRSRPATANCSA